MILQISSTTLREFDEVQEEEAKCLGAALQLAKPCLFWANKRSMSYEDIANYFNASKDMVTYRMNMTGIAKRTHFLKMRVKFILAFHRLTHTSKRKSVSGFSLPSFCEKQKRISLAILSIKVQN